MLKLITVLLVFSSPFSSCTPISMIKRQGFQLCGSMLAEALSMICGGEIYGPGHDSTKKRTVPEEETADIYSRLSLGFLDDNKRNEAENKATINRRQMNGIVEECCRNSCSISVLASYCGK